MPLVQHLRLVVPAATSALVVQALESGGVVTNLVVLPGAARHPDGDLVLCDVPREAASTVIALLTDLGVDRDGAIMMNAVDLSLSRATEAAEAAAPGLPTDAVVWEEVESRAQEESTLSGTYLTFMIVATLLAGFGVLLDSPVLVVGAMVVGPEFGAIAGLCVGVVQRRAREVRRSANALVVGFVVAMASTAVLMRLFDAIGVIDGDLIAGDRPFTAFVSRPDAASFVVALCAGVAGMLSLTSAKSGALIGVLISVTTIPAAGDAAVSVVFGQLAEARGSALQLLLNVAGIVIAGVATLLVQKAVIRRRGGPAELRRAHRATPHLP